MMKMGKRTIRLRFFFIFILLILICSYGVYSIFLKSTTIFLHTGDIEEIQNCKVTILRDESVVYSEDYGKITYLVSEGERVTKGTPILELYKLGFDENMIKDLNEIQIKIKNYQQENILKNIIDNDLNQINNQIDAQTFKINQYIKNNEENKVQLVERQIKALMIKRQNYLQKTIEADDYLNNLYEKEKEANIRIQAYKTSVNAEDSGVISFYFDGCENLLGMDKLDQLTSSDVKNIISKTVPIKTTEAKVQRPIYRIINNYKWYLLLADTSEVEFLINNEYNISFDTNSNRIYKGKIIKINKTDKKNLVIIEMLEDIGSLVSDRNIGVTISKKTNGFIIPINALEKRGTQNGVFIMNQSNKSFVSIKILTQNKKYAIIEEEGIDKLLTQNTRIVVK